MLVLLLAVAGSVNYGRFDFVGGMASRGGQARRAAIVSAPISLAFAALAALVTGARWSTATLIYGVAGGLVALVSLVLLYRCPAWGPMSVLSPLTASVSVLVPWVPPGCGQGVPSARP